MNQIGLLYVDGEVISTTGEHPLWTPDKGWMEAKDLMVGGLLQLEDGRIVDIDKVEKREGNFAVYNFNVESFHTYFVSNLGILVHNAGNLYLGDGIKVDADKFHTRTKKQILKRAKSEGYDYPGIVGDNPDIKVVNGEIQLVASRSSPYKGGTLPTTIPSSEFFD